MRSMLSVFSGLVFLGLVTNLFAKSISYSFDGKTYILVDMMVLLENRNITVKGTLKGGATKEIKKLKAPAALDANLKKLTRMKSLPDFIARIKQNPSDSGGPSQFAMPMFTNWLKNVVPTPGVYQEITIEGGGGVLESVVVTEYDKNSLISEVGVTKVEDAGLQTASVGVYIPDNLKTMIPCVYLSEAKAAKGPYKKLPGCNLGGIAVPVGDKTYNQLAIFDKPEGEYRYYKVNVELLGGVPAFDSSVVEIRYPIRPEPVLIQSCAAKAGKKVEMKWKPSLKARLITHHQILYKPENTETATVLVEKVPATKKDYIADLSKIAVEGSAVELMVKSVYKDDSTAVTFGSQCTIFSRDLK